jgi:hypothetical protein
MEEKVKCDIFMVSYKCPKCEKGHLVKDEKGVEWLTDPPRFPHKCDNPDCNHEEIFTGKYYPHIAYEEQSLFERLRIF